MVNEVELGEGRTRLTDKERYAIPLELRVLASHYDSAIALHNASYTKDNFFNSAESIEELSKRVLKNIEQLSAKGSVLTEEYKTKLITICRLFAKVSDECIGKVPVNLDEYDKSKHRELLKVGGYLGIRTTLIKAKLETLGIVASK